MSRADNYEHLKRLIQAFAESYRGAIYHYTSAEGISVIIGKHEIWMSNTAFLNDPTELTELGKATDLLEDKDFKYDAVREEWSKTFDRDRFNKDRQFDYYMASFSRKRDSLEQWRAYGNFCIGFDASKLKFARERHIFLYKCLYTHSDIRNWILKMQTIPEWKSLPDKDRTNAAYNLLYVASMKYKNRHFSSEKEIRLFDNNGLAFDSNENETFKVGQALRNQNTFTHLLVTSNNLLKTSPDWIGNFPRRRLFGKSTAPKFPGKWNERIFLV